MRDHVSFDGDIEAETAYPYVRQADGIIYSAYALALDSGNRIPASKYDWRYEEEHALYQSFGKKRGVQFAAALYKHANYLPFSKRGH